MRRRRCQCTRAVEAESKHRCSLVCVLRQAYHGKEPMGSRGGPPKRLETVGESCRDRYRTCVDSRFLGRVEWRANVGRAEEGFGSIASSANQPGSTHTDGPARQITGTTVCKVAKRSFLTLIAPPSAANRVEASSARALIEHISSGRSPAVSACQNTSSACLLSRGEYHPAAARPSLCHARPRPASARCGHVDASASAKTNAETSPSRWIACPQASLAPSLSPPAPRPPTPTPTRRRSGPARTMDFQVPQNGMYDPTSFVDPSALGNPQMNGTRPYPMSSIPQKRDSTGATLSRSQTPSQQPQFGLQQGFSHTPSPTMQNQHFRPGTVAPQRMQTVSPAQNPSAPQMSPMGFAQGSPLPPGYRPTSGGQFQVQPVQLSSNLQRQQQEAQRQYTARLQAQQQQLGNLAASNMAAQQRHHAASQMPNYAAQQMAMQRQMAQGQGQMQQNLQNNPQAQAQAFLKNVAALMAQQNRPFNPQPQAAGRVINLHMLYYTVMKMKGYQYVSQTQQWPRIAQALNINLQQYPTAGDELRLAYEQNLVPYERVYIQKTQAQQAMKNNINQQPAMGAMGPQMSPTRPTMPNAPNSMSEQQQQYFQQLQRSKQLAMQQQHQQPTGQQPFDQPNTLQSNGAMASTNGWSTPQPDGKMAADALEQHRKSLSRTLESTPPQGQGSVHLSPSPGPSKMKEAAAQEASPAVNGVKEPIEEIDPSKYRPTTRTGGNIYGGLEVGSHELENLAKTLVEFRPNVPTLSEMGVIDIRALTMSIRSGLHAECRLALDILAKLTYEGGAEMPLELDKCDDLVEVLIEYAEEELEILANENPEVSDIIDLTPYEDVVHHCRTEFVALRDHSEFGTNDYDLDRTADRILAITVILRNLSFHEINHFHLASPTVLKFIATAIRLVGTRVLFLRSHANTFEFMKDLVTFFSNTSTKISLPSRDDAYTILHFLCAFAPVPRPGMPVRFTPYHPKIHQCLPSAVDSLAKLLARDDPNRTYFKQIFANEASSTPPYDLLTRTFGLAIAVVPDRTVGKLHDVAETRIGEVRFIEARIAEARKPYLMQGMLAGDILATLAPGPDTGVCRSWLESEDGWAVSLIKLAMSLCSTDSNMPPQSDPRTGRGQPPLGRDVEGFQLIVHRALSLLKRLGDKSKGGEVLVKGAQTNGHMDVDDEDDDDMDTIYHGGSTWRVKADVLPKKETLLSALLTPGLDARSLRQYCSIGYLDTP
ncbi:hypothetical protein BDV96DRAFT_592972 [Lophiotrema nucula]|uniref:ARID domain-containing protein n=1 Tax=Lophiotrema nucula TaxID=690887 RepID=A0A6A5ZTU8_9PLEO|nr:hypothetical protein BDV96DRAFT_592972 [Lophiotrema nucula]